MNQLESALASADGSAQSWNEVYQHPKACSSLKSYKKRFRLAQKIESQALESLKHLDVDVASLPHDCGLKTEVLEQYIKACGLDVDLGVGSLVLALNRLPHVVTLSSCNSVHVGAHEEEALVAFTAPPATAESLRCAVSERHFRVSREDVVKPQKVGQRGQVFSSYIVFSDARDQNNAIDALQRLRDMMSLAERVDRLVLSPPAADPGAPKISGVPGGIKVAQLGDEELKCLKTQWSDPKLETPVISVNAFQSHELDDLRDQLVSELKGLQAIETQHTVALVLPFSEISPEAIPALQVLRATFEAVDLRNLLGSITGMSQLTSPPSCALVAVPPGGHVFPQSFGGHQYRTGLGFSLFLTEDWWTEGDGGLLELFGETAASTKVVPRGGVLYVYQAQACEITRVLSDEAPQLAVHGIFVAAAPQLSNFCPSFSSCQSDFASDQLLEDLISPKYLEPDYVEALCRKFEDESQLRLPNFLRRDRLEKVAAALQESEKDDNLRSGWKLCGPVLHRRVCTFGKLKGKGKKSKSHCSAGKALAEIAGVFSSPAFLRYLGQLTAVNCTSTSLWIRRFRPGLDYERPSTGQAQLDVVLAFETLRGPPRRRRRRLRLLGGAEVYAEQDAADKTAEAAGLMAGANGVPCAAEALLRLPLANNVLRLVLRDAQTSHLTEPLMSRSPTSRWEIRLALPTELDEVEPSPKRRRKVKKPVKRWPIEI